MESSRVPPTSQALEPGCFSAVSRRGSCRCRGTANRRRPRLLTLAAFAFASVVVSGAVLSVSARAGNWTLPEDTGQLKINTSRQATAESDNRAALEPPSEKLGFKPTIEYGLTDGITMGVNNEYELIKSGFDHRAGRTDGFMNTEVFLRGRLRDQDWYMLSLQDLMPLPGQEKASQGDSSLRLQYGRSGRLAGGTWTSSIKSGFHPSLDEVPDKLQTDLTVGWRPGREWQFTAQSFNTLALDNGDGSVSSGIDMAKGQFSVVRYLNRSLSVHVGGWQAMSDGDSGPANGFDAVMWLRY